MRSEERYWAKGAAMPGFGDRSSEDRAQALTLATEARVRARKVRGMLACGRMTVADAFELDEARSLRMRYVLMSVDGIGRERAESAMQAAGIVSNRRVRGVGPRQRERLMAVLEAMGRPDQTRLTPKSQRRGWLL